MNLKPINDVPEIESLQEGDKILVNSNGLAKQIAAEKVGGSGGGMGTFYGEPAPGPDNSGLMFTAYSDKELTVPMTYAEGKEMVENGGMRLCMSAALMGDVNGWMYVIPAMVIPIDEQYMIMGSIAMGADVSELWIVFSDTPGISGEEG